MGMRGDRIGIGELVDLAEAIDRDKEASAAVLRRRDRDIGRRHEGLRGKPAGQLLAWLHETSGGRSDLPGSTVARTLRYLNLLLLAAGLMLGWLAAAAVFYYDGSHPVNVINVLAVFVFLQVLLVLLLLLTLLPGRLLRSLPGIGSALETLELFRPGRVLELASRRLPDRHRLRISEVLGSGRRGATLYGAVGRWSVTRLSQLFAVAFNTGALAGALQLVLFSDLAFAWSTTLQVSAAQVHRITALLSSPWAAWLPQASPGVKLVESSRYFRLKEGLLPAADAAGDPAVLGEWWPFLLMALVCYGLLPRVLLLLLASRRLRSSARSAFLSWPGAAQVLERMNDPFVTTRAPESEVTGAVERAGKAAARPPQEKGDRVCINWSEAPFSDDVLRSCNPAGTCRGEILAAGGGNSMEDDRETVRRAAAAGAAAATIFAKAWEPPMEDLIDFLGDLRTALGRTVPLTIVLVGTPDGGSVGPVGGEVVRVWESRFAGLGDAWIFVLAGRRAGG